MKEIIAHIVQPINWFEIILSLCTVVLSLCAVIISILTARSQKTHNMNSVRPLLGIVVGDYEDDLYVRIDNNGVGPAIITNIKCCATYNVTCKEGKSLVELLPVVMRVKCGNTTELLDLTKFTDFVEDITNRVIPVGGSITLVRLARPSEMKKQALRYALSKCRVEVSYSDIYDSKPWSCTRDLDFFGRTINGTYDFHIEEAQDYQAETDN